MDNQSRILAIVKRVSGKSAAPDVNESLFDSGLLDSESILDLVSGIEKEFGIKVPDRDATPRKFDSVASIQNYVEGRLSA